MLKNLFKMFINVVISGGFRISRWGGGGGGGADLLGGANLRCVHFLAKMYAKTKEMDPVGGARADGAPLDPPMVMYSYLHYC